MIEHIPSARIYRATPTDWLDSLHHFSFAEYYDPRNMGFGALRVLNDDIIAGRSGFDLHPHRDMEIITYMISGELAHRDSLGNSGAIRRGDVQYMSAGRGIVHSEHNLADGPARLLQIWVLPSVRGLEPAYGQRRFDARDRKNRLLPIASGADSAAPIRLNQDASMYAAELDDGAALSFDVEKGRQCYLVQVEGGARVNGAALQERDALKAAGESLEIRAEGRAHVFLIEMAAPGS
ncbi:MAG: pirin family protein [Treponema sp.]|nr:pirin family protein [Treponema sp.]